MEQRYIHFKLGNYEYIKCLHNKYNSNRLSISNTKISQSQINGEYYPNDLHSYNIIYHSGSLNVLYVFNGNFIGSYYGIYLESGSAKIINCSLQQSRVALYAEGVDEFIMQYCEIKNNGKYNGPFPYELF